MKRRSEFRMPDQGGAALIVVLIILILVTLLGLASMRGALMQERMAASTVARGVAFQAAESGLRQAELIARDGMVTFPSKANPTDAGTCSAGRCSNPGTAASPWEANNFWNDGNSGYQLGTEVGTGNMAITPKFVIEDLGLASVIDSSGSSGGGNIDASIPPPSSVGGRQQVYRITSHATTRTGAEVMLQTMYRR